MTFSRTDTRNPGIPDQKGRVAEVAAEVAALSQAYPMADG
jgi:hypothetical protein